MKFNQHYVIQTKIWQDEVLVIFTDSIKESLIHYFKKFKIREAIPNHDYDFVGALFLAMREVKSTSPPLWMVFPVKDCWSGLIAHECLHATSNILSHRGLKMSEETEEAFTYTQQYLIEQVEQCYTHAKKKYKK